jgi:hypothetical protein
MPPHGLVLLRNDMYSLAEFQLLQVYYALTKIQDEPL